MKDKVKVNIKEVQVKDNLYKVETKCKGYPNDILNVLIKALASMVAEHSEDDKLLKDVIKNLKKDFEIEMKERWKYE